MWMKLRAVEVAENSSKEACNLPYIVLDCIPPTMEIVIYKRLP